MKTMMETMIEARESEHYTLIKKHLAIVLDFVERWNKQDKERDVAYAAHFLEGLLTKTKD